MSGHSKWSQIKRQKGANDAKRGAVFTKVARDITLAARSGGGADPDGNYKLRLAIEKARAVNMPADNIKRAIDRAAGAGEGEQIEEIVYEGYGPGGVAILVEAATDNRNRTAADVRAIFTKAGGQLAGSGAVAWQFEPRGYITVGRDGNDPDEVALLAIDAGATTWTPTDRSRSRPTPWSWKAFGGTSRRPAWPSSRQSWPCRPRTPSRWMPRTRARTFA
jgi:YebC/PmpR family DNA-binding regulatory protein